MDPWGTPQVRGATEETVFPMPTEKVLSHRMDLKQLRAWLRIPTQCSRCKIRMVWSTISNAELRSNRTRITESPEMADNRMSFSTLRRADSVLWFLLKPDWNVSKILFVYRNVCNCNNTDFKFAIKGKLGIGLKWDKTVVSKLGFFKIGLTKTCLQKLGTDPVRTLIYNF